MWKFIVTIAVLFAFGAQAQAEVRFEIRFDDTSLAGCLENDVDAFGEYLCINSADSKPVQLLFRPGTELSLLQAAEDSAVPGVMIMLEHGPMPLLAATAIDGQAPGTSCRSFLDKHLWKCSYVGKAEGVYVLLPEAGEIEAHLERLEDGTMMVTVLPVAYSAEKARAESLRKSLSHLFQ